MMADATGTLESVPIDWQHPEPVRQRAPAGRSWSERLGAALTRSAAAPSAAGEIAAANANVAPDPLAIRQRLYGRGSIIPGDAAWLLSLVEPFHLGASSAMLDLAAGLGGPARAIAQAFHARVTGIERDYDRARQANAMSSALGAAPPAHQTRRP
jgi:16S rRNA C967 or C1407 C5-methylase (RsmB/RsmF family)